MSHENENNVEEDDMVDMQRLFTSDIARMMYGSGDDKNPLGESIQLMETMVLDYITKLCIQAKMLSDSNDRQVSHHDFMFLSRKDPSRRQKLLKQLDFYDEINGLRKTKFKQIEECSSPTDRQYIWDNNININFKKNTNNNDNIDKLSSKRK